MSCSAFCLAVILISLVLPGPVEGKAATLSVSDIANAAANASLDLGARAIVVGDVGGSGVDVAVVGRDSRDTGASANHLFIGQTSNGTQTLGIVSDSSDLESTGSVNAFLNSGETMTLRFSQTVSISQLAFAGWGLGDTENGPFEITGFCSDPQLTSDPANNGSYAIAYQPVTQTVYITHSGGFDHNPRFNLTSTVSVSTLEFRLTTPNVGKGIGFNAATFASQAETCPPPAAWTFASLPDMFNADVGDISGCSDPALVGCAHNVPAAAGWPSVSGGLNSLTAQMDEAYNAIVGEMLRYGPECLIVAGDLIQGRWFNTTTTNMFAPGENRATAVFAAAEIYYGWFQHLFNRNGIFRVLAAVGDHDIGDNDWPAGGEKAIHVAAMRNAFDLGMVAPLGGLPDINGVPARPVGTPYEPGSFAYQVHNVLFVQVDVFRQDSPFVTLHPINGSVRTEIAGDHLIWFQDLLTATDTDPTIDHVIVQAHPPVLSGVRKRASSGMMMADRDDSVFWTTMQAHSHQNGGKVRLYFAGEVHAVTATKDPNSDLVQVVCGAPPIGSRTNFLIGDVMADRIELELINVSMTSTGPEKFWQSSKASSNGNLNVTGFSTAGRLVIDVSGPVTQYQAEGELQFVDSEGLLVHFSLDDDAGAPPYNNTGELGNIHFYEGLQRGDPTLTSGKLGNARNFDGTGDYIESGMAPVTEGEARTLTAWLRTTSNEGFLTFASYGKEKDFLGRFNCRITNGLLELNLKNGVTVAAAGAPLVNDGNWRHVAVVLPEVRYNTVGDLRFYIDGQAYAATGAAPTLELITFPGGNNFLIGVAMSETWGHFVGDIDDVGLWGRALSSGEINALRNFADVPTLAYNSRAMSTLFDAFKVGAAVTFVQGRTWVPASGLTGPAGMLMDLGAGRFGLALDNEGAGLRALPLGDADADDDVDLFDVAVVQRNVETAAGATPASGDHDGDGDVDVDDALTVINELGQGL